MSKPKKSRKTTWQSTVARYQSPDNKRSWGQVANSLIPYFALWVLMWFSLKVSYWLTLTLSVLAAGFLMRIFIIFHDAGHGSFFKSRRLNAMVGNLTGLLTFTPYERWRRDHAIHHATAGDLDRRGVGDVPTMTLDEYRAALWRQRLVYRLIRNPLVLFGLGPLFVFLGANRFFTRTSGKTEKWGVIWTNVALAVLITLACLVMGWKEYLLIQLPIIWIGGALGEWLFYVQHQFEGVYWRRHQDWDYYASAMQGASYYKLPKILQWFTGNIGFHHIHHLSPKIPNYKLEQCHKENPIFHNAKTLSLKESLKSLRLRIYDEYNKQLVGWSEV